MNNLRGNIKVATEYGPCNFFTFYHLVDQKEHIALVFKNAHKKQIPLVRIHSECLTGDVFGSSHCDCGDQLKESMHVFSKFGGIILYLRQEGRGIGLYNKLDAYALQNKGYDTFEANKLLNLPDDIRNYTVAAQMLLALDINSVRLVSNNPDKVKQLEKFGIRVIERISTGLFIKQYNAKYLSAKCKKSGHVFSKVHNLSTYFPKDAKEANYD